MSSTAGIYVGGTVTGNGIATGAVVTAITGNTVWLSGVHTAAVTAGGEVLAQHRGAAAAIGRSPTVRKSGIGTVSTGGSSKKKNPTGVCVLRAKSSNCFNVGAASPASHAA
jgi:hypothetical protein